MCSTGWPAELGDDEDAEEDRDKVASTSTGKVGETMFVTPLMNQRYTHLDCPG